MGPGAAFMLGFLMPGKIQSMKTGIGMEQVKTFYIKDKPCSTTPFNVRYELGLYEERTHSS